MEAEKHRRRPALGTCLAGKYEVERLLGEGSMGAVYAARNLATGKTVAIKWLIAERETDYALVDRFRREARAAGRVDHPNVVTIFDVGIHDTAVFLVMELLRGEPLSDVLMRGPLEPEETVGLMIPVMRGVAAAHASGVVHRDLKPENVFVCRAPDGTLREPKVLDFGISKLVGDAAKEELRATRTGVVVGTPTYMSPEQIGGTPDIDARIDVYALGVMLYEMLAGRPPFMAGTYTALVVQIATAIPPDLRELRPNIDPALVDVVEKAMARDRDERFADVESLARALEPFGDGARFRPEAPSWSLRVGPGRRGSEKLSSTADGRAVASARELVPTVAAETLESGLRATGSKPAAAPGAGPAPEAEDAPLDASAPVGLSTEPTAVVAEAEVPGGRPSEDSFRVDTPAGRRRVALIGALVGVALLAVGLALGVSLRGDDETPAAVPRAATAPEEASTVEPSPSEVEAEAEAEGEPAARGETEAEAQAQPALAEIPEAAPAAAAPAPTQRRGRRRARRAAVMRPESAAGEAAAMTAEPTMAGAMSAAMSVGRHRAGALSVDEF